MHKKLLVSLFIIFTLFLISEFIFKELLFSDFKFMEKFRDPRLYADYFSDENYWFISTYIDKIHKAPENPHPLLGWIGEFNQDTFLHYNANQIQGRQTVLLFGDSFAAGRDRPLFEEILNNDNSFNKKCFFLNYGVGGYGIDQTYLLMKNSIKLYPNPIVIFSALTEDIDRNVLGFRTGQKPKFEVKNSELILTNIPIENSNIYIEKHKPKIFSYLLGLTLYGNVLPEHIQNFLKNENYKKQKMILLTNAILEEVENSLKNLSHFYLFFVGNWNGVSSISDESDWRLETLVNFANQRNLSFVNSKDIIRTDIKNNNVSLDKYFIPNNGHYTGYANQVIAKELKSRLSSYCE